MRVALLQAREYFRAAELCSVYTSPNHLYYGLTSLASTILLLRGDGTSSFDYLRKDNANRSHGLRFSTGVGTLSKARGLNLLSNSHVDVLSTGHFRNWYSVLPDREPAIGRVTRTTGTTTLVSNEIVGWERVEPFSILNSAHFKLIDLIRRLPDLSNALSRAGLQTRNTRITHDQTVPIQGATSHCWRLHGASSAADLEHILDEFKFSASVAGHVDVQKTPAQTAVLVTFAPTTDVSGAFSWPSSRERLDNEFVAFAEALNTHEFTDFYLIAFGLSMLARYFPDLWVATIDAHGIASKIVEAFVDIALQKTPLLTLRLLSSPGLTISMHKPSWY
jgi:hypothetical protein